MDDKLILFPFLIAVRRSVEMLPGVVVEMPLARLQNTVRISALSVLLNKRSSSGRFQFLRQHQPHMLHASFCTA